MSELDNADVLADKFCDAFLSNDEGFRAKVSEPMQSFFVAY